MASEKEILDEQGFVTDRISSQVRAIALSMIAVVWLFLSGGGNLSYFSEQPSSEILLLCILLSFGALVLDYFQYVAGYFSIRQTHAKGPDAANSYSYDYDSWAYMARGWMFAGKQVVLIAAVGLFALAMLKPLI